MKPDRSNYEVWLIDWLDGTLDEIWSEQFTAFLDETPDIKAEAEFLSSTRLLPERHIFTGKNGLKKTAEELSAAQVEYFSVAYLEKDLPQEQLADLEHNLEHNRENRILFNSIQKIKLVPPAEGYKHKKSLKKFTSDQKVFRITISTLSAAATIAILILSYIFVPGFVSKKDNQNASEIIQDTTPVPLYIISSNPIIDRGETGIPANEIANTFHVTSPWIDSGKINYQPVALAVSDSLPVNRAMENQAIPRIGVPAISGINFEMPQYSLIASNNKFTEPVYDDERSRIRRFVAQIFREKLLKEETYSDDPLKPYEIARAGIDGLNKLLDWQMQLVETRDEAGVVKSVQFISGLLTFNAPVRKTDE
jgi:hypothetical protein